MIRLQLGMEGWAGGCPHQLLLCNRLSGSPQLLSGLDWPGHGPSGGAGLPAVRVVPTSSRLGA